MLRKAKPRLKCKGNLIPRKPLDTEFSRVGVALANSIPVLSIFALVGITISSIIPFELENRAYAAPAPSCPDGNDYIQNEDGVCVPNFTTPTAVTPSVSFTIDSGVIHDTIHTGRGTTAYASHTINVNASNIEDYQLTLTPTKALTGPSSLSNASGQTGSNLAANTWGYGWGSTSTSDANLTYNSLATSVQLTGDNVVDGSINFSRKLAFAAKFGDNADEGTYNASINLALTVTPQKMVAWDDMVYLQDMSPATCASVAVGTSRTLKDWRDQNTYTVLKHSDGNCWMTQNLRIVNKTISSTDSDMTSGSFTIPASSTSGFSSDTASNAYYGSNTTYGAYYTWCAATAGSCSSATTAGANATNSICPKGWKLPVGTPGTGTNDFAKAIGLATTNIAASTNYWSSLSSPSFASNALTVNGITWPAAGFYSSSSASDVGTEGVCWSRTAYSSTSAYNFYFYSGRAVPASNIYRRYGFSVRCVAYSS